MSPLTKMSIGLGFGVSATAGLFVRDSSMPSAKINAQKCQ